MRPLGLAHRALLVLAFGSPLLCALPARAAAPKDAQAEKAITQAMDVDYLETKFDQAEKRLRTAIDACGADKCTPSVKARALVALGVVLAGGKKQLEDAREVFVEALSLDKTVKPDEDMSSGEVRYAYENARKQLKLDGAPGPSAGGQPAPSGQGMTHTTPPEQRVDTPLPLYVRLAPELIQDAKKVAVNYLAPGASDWKTLVMKKVGEFGFGINVPCTEVTKEGNLDYYITITDADGAIVTGAGSRTQPLRTAIKARIEGEPPSWPGFAPPELCVKVESGPKQCLDDNQCNAGYSCVAGECTQKLAGGGEEPKDTGPRKNWVSITIAPDISIFSGKDVCTVDVQERDHFVCVRGDGSRYLGAPTPGVANDVSAGLALSTIRVVAGYDRLFLDNILAGVRVGFAFRTSSAESASFLPVHAELRGSYFIGKTPFESLGARPFVFAAAGLAQIDTPVNVEVLEDGVACGAANPSDQNSPCTRPGNPTYEGTYVEPRIQTLKAYKQAGQGFLALGGGLQYAPLERVAISVGLRANVTLPVVTFVLTPEVGATIGF
ncbi:hypothetical protein [Polyangium jinanense]|uniref:Tetratricopeptide repeat protein n=1 Tax=Polyangium jinanense TaxID=2829994 RepID=A0A9X3XB31_9BACT|nr:hypothetical protein [Polyangium jinanense]MDC3959314.1 hypothetical protein [Polyangium jinanense]MDC3985723.1 hypothetical protein [Polyangium jinanense]